MTQEHREKVVATSREVHPNVPAPSVAIFGAGIAGLAAAHELVRRGFKIVVYEALPEAGGFFRSARLPKDEGMPSEYSWHGMGPWYLLVPQRLRHHETDPVR